MMIEAQRRKGVYIKDIAEQLGVSSKTVSRAIERGGAPKGVRSGARHSKLDRFKPTVDYLLQQEVWNAVVIFRELQERGYQGGISILRDYIRPKRALRQSRGTVRFETEPGRQMQNDWGEVVSEVAGRRQRVFFNVSILGYSRRFFFWCCARNDAEHTFEGIVRAFEYFGGSPREVLVDNQKAVVVSHRIGEAVRFNPRFIDFVQYYGVIPRACRPRRARTKGKDERMVGYIKHNFFVRYRRFESFEHMNQMAIQWLSQEADQRVHGTVKEVVIERFIREAPQLSVLPAVRYDASYREHRFVCWDGHIDIRGNRYSVPAELCGHTVAIHISLDGSVKVFDGDRLVVEHRLRHASEGWVTLPAHHQQMWKQAFAVQRRDLSVYEEAGLCN